MSLRAQLILSGWIATEPEVKEVNGKQLLTFSVADKERDDHTTWYRVSAWGKEAEFNAHLSKGAYGTIIGNLASRAYETKTGEARTSLELTPVMGGLRFPKDSGGDTNFDD